MFPWKTERLGILFKYRNPKLEIQFLLFGLVRFEKFKYLT